MSRPGTYVYRVGEGWLDGKEPRNGLCQFDAAVDHHTRPTYDFTDIHSTGKPVRIHGKAHWRQHLKENGLTDDTSFSDSYLDRRDKERNQLPESTRRKIREAIGDAIKVVSQKPYSTIGKTLSSSEIRSQLAEARRQQERKRNG
jgi:hypothetical protein